MSSSMTPETFEIDPYMHAGSAIGNAFFSGLSLEEVFSCARLAETVEGFDEAVSATIKLRELGMSIEPTCHYCNHSTKGRCRSEDEASTCYLHIEREKILKPTVPPKPPSKARPPAQISLTMHSTEVECDDITVASHADGHADLISIHQGGKIVTLTTDDVDALIDNLNTVLQHLQQGTRK